VIEAPAPTFVAGPEFVTPDQSAGVPTEVEALPQPALDLDVPADVEYTPADVDAEAEPLLVSDDTPLAAEPEAPKRRSRGGGASKKTAKAPSAKKAAPKKTAAKKAPAAKTARKRRAAESDAA
jgi:hypothetical protein